MPQFDLPANSPTWLYALMICMSAAVPLIGAVALIMKRRAEAALVKVRAEIEAQKATAAREMQQIKTESAQALAASRSIEALTNTLATMVDERKESTAATRENTEQLRNFNARMGDWDERQRLFFQSFTTNTTAFHSSVAAAIKALETVIEKAIGSVSSSINSVIPQMVSQVSPLVERITALVEEIKNTHTMDQKKLDVLIAEIERMTAQLQSLETKIEKIIETKEQPHEPENSTDRPAAADAVLPAGILYTGTGAGGFEYQPAGV